MYTPVVPITQGVVNTLSMGTYARQFVSDTIITLVVFSTVSYISDDLEENQGYE